MNTDATGDASILLRIDHADVSTSLVDPPPAGDDDCNDCSCTNDCGTGDDSDCGCNEYVTSRSNEPMPSTPRARSIAP